MVQTVEYRIPLPLTVEEYRIAQLYMLAVGLFTSCCTVLYPTVLSCTVLHCTLTYGTVLSPSTLSTVLAADSQEFVGLTAVVFTRL